MKQTSTRAGKMVKNLNGYAAFVPAKLPPDPPITIDSKMQNLLSQADRNLGRLDGITQILPNPELFVAMYVKKEAVLSAQIEGTQASLIDVLNQQVDREHGEYSPDGVKEVINYVNAMSWGLSELDRLPLSLRLIRNIHEVLLKNVRGANKSPGEFRRSQNWIGPMGCTLEKAKFVPPTADDMQDAMAALESFMHEEDDLPPLIKIALIHAQFETIHPFLDGNGRMGRLLITFWLCQQKVLSQPLLYLSYYFKQNRDEYYEKLMAIRADGNWESWIKFFLKGVAMVADEATETAKQIISIQRKYSAELYEKDRSNGHYQTLLNLLFETPIISRKDVMNMLHTTSPTAGALLDTFSEVGILRDLTPEKQRYKTYVFDEYMNIIQKGTELPE